MKKILLILLCLPMIGFGQSLNQAISGKIEYTELLTEQDFKEYWKNNSKNIDNIIGLYECAYDGGDPSLNNYVFGVIKEKEIYKFISIGGKWGHFDVKPGGVKMVAKKMYNNTYQMRWRMSLASRRMNGFFKKNGNLLEFTLSNLKFHFIKYFSPFEIDNIRTESNDWVGNGSGIIISKFGHIVTNHHVIDDADDIEVEFILDDEIQKFNAEIVQSDKINDLAIIKIVDARFDGVKVLPYNFKKRVSDVGTKVYAFGYPMALSIMGKEIKVTDGIISSKTGYDGDITKYQITAPIQGGNSGGPLFDDKGNLIGINAAKLNVNIADNVGYSIKTSYVLNLVDILPKSIDLPSNTKLAKLPLTEQIKEISKYVVLVKVK